MKNQIFKFIFMLSCIIMIIDPGLATAEIGTAHLPDDLKDWLSDPATTDEEKATFQSTASPANLGAGISAGVNVASGATAATTFERMANIRSDSMYAKLGHSPIGPAGNTSVSNILRAPGSWGKIYGIWGDQDDIDNKKGFDYDVTGIMLGYDVQSSNNWLFGINAGYSYIELDSGVNTDTDIDTINVGLYASYSKGQMYIDYGIMYSHGDIDNDRTIILGATSVRAESDTYSDAYTGYLEAGYEFPFSNYIITPFVGAMYSKVKVDDYDEKTPSMPSVGLIVDDVDDDFYSTTLGVKAEYFVDNILHLKGRVSWSHEFSDDLQSTTNARFNSPGTSYFKTDGIDLDEDRFGIGIGMKYQYSPEITFDLDYDLELAEDFDSHTGTLGMEYKF